MVVFENNCNFRENFNDMEVAVKTKRKVIDIKPDTYQGLTIIAAKRGINLKHFIELSLTNWWTRMRILCYMRT